MTTAHQYVVVPTTDEFVADSGMQHDMNVKSPALDGVHHLSVAVTDLDASLAWWERVFGAERRPHLDHADSDGTIVAYVLAVPGLDNPLLLRLDRRAAEALGGIDVVTLAVPTRENLSQWAGHLDALGIEHSTVLRGYSGWVLSTVTPDYFSVKLYSRESHEWDPDGADPPWAPLANRAAGQ